MRLSQTTLGVLGTCLLLASTAAAQDATLPLEVDVDRGADELAERVRVEPPDRDFVNTALVFTSGAQTRTRVRCVARNQNGEPIGRASTVVPRMGLRFILASDLAGGQDFAGSVQCRSSDRMVGTALLLGVGGVTDLPVRRSGFDGHIGLNFPVVVTR